MATPCPRCGHTKTESVRHGFVYRRLWNMGYHLRRCSFCNRKRIFKRDRSQPHPDDVTAEQLTAYFNRKIAEAKGVTYVPSKGYGGNMALNSSEESSEIETRDGSSIGVAEAPEEVYEYRVCPKCGSGSYRRSRRRWYEKMVKRPKMARCLKCDHRFPYPH